ncbi:LysM-like peptidoglycan-binding domain-containing protein [Mangrovibacter yixingensis]|uniref:LysM-like peptidoglycan-binding domain-containing protein n=1 Tax=Mangrovibacter yixingensis TaxID=1529639 RepID=UPI001CFE5CD2|nr:LysM-like peptidoglycan-binding domain-containing protein [Mangrovibacter yixingensis]
MPGQFALKAMIHRVWHAPDDFRLMDPLPALHRRGIIIGIALVVVGVLLPADNPPVAPVSRETPLSLPGMAPATPGGQNTNSAFNQPVVTTPPRYNEPQPAQTEPVLRSPEESIQPDNESESSGSSTAGRTSHERSSTASNATSTTGQAQWHTWRVEPGKTLAQLFRDHNLPPTDVYAMANVEGPDKPLSSLQSGQQVQVRVNGNGVVTGLIVNDNDNRQVLFTRESNGNFIRAR